MSEYITAIATVVLVGLFLIGKFSLRFTNDEYQISLKFEYRLFFEEPNSPHSFKFEITWSK